MRLKKKKSETFSVLKIVHKRINMHIQMHFDVMLPNQESSELISHPQSIKTPIQKIKIVLKQIYWNSYAFSTK